MAALFGSFPADQDVLNLVFFYLRIEDNNSAWYTAQNPTFWRLFNHLTINLFANIKFRKLCYLSTFPNFGVNYFSEKFQSC